MTSSSIRRGIAIKDSRARGYGMADVACYGQFDMRLA